MDYLLNCFLAFVTLFATDFCWAAYVGRVKNDSPMWASTWALGLFLLGGVAVLTYTRDPWMLLPASVGAFFGTYAGVVWNRRSG